jgi:O-acetylserine/cysteine efflux transporter
MRPPDVLAAILVALIWGVNVSFIKICVAEFPPVFITGLRFLIVALMLIWWVPVPRRQLRMIALLSFAFGGLHFGGVFFGLRGIDASIVSILTLTGVPFSVLFARLLLKERFSRQKTCGMLIAFVGVAILFGEPATTVSPVHLGVLFVAIMAWGLGNTIIKMIGPINVFALNSWMGLFASVQLLLFSLLLEEGQLASLQNASAKAWGALAFIVFGATLIGYGLWYYLVGKYEVTRVVPFTLLVPIAGMLGGALLLGEELTLLKIGGGAVIICGVAIIQLRRRQRSGADDLPAAGPAG